ncbi:MAG TPA: hypothetical protein VHM26_04210 [Chitinophagaceae bacterium]|jgi:hypothetical protein|nr:hypothetical protein [Chitinophagaceae bacterium]
MKKINLDHDFSFAMEAYERGVRLIVFNGKEEWVCRKEKVSRLKTFLSGNDSRLFKGRLQLHKQNGSVGIEIKGTLIGKISAEQFSQCLD